jgi:hypothetical protein
VLIEALALNLRMPAGDAFAFFTEPADMWAAIPVEVGLGVSAKGIITGN